MSGIVGYIGHRAAWSAVISGLSRLERRVYDSVGVATISRRRFRVARQVGRLAELTHHHADGLPGKIGLGHTRWATHGAVVAANCHPHMDEDGDIALVHNGILSNAEVLRAQLLNEGAALRSETDSELLAVLIGRLLRSGEAGDLVAAVKIALGQVRGTAGVVVASRRAPDRLVVASVGSPMWVGLGEDEAWIVSDVEAFDPGVSRRQALDDGQIAEVTLKGVRTVDLEQRARAARLEALEESGDAATLSEHPHHMLREIIQQPAVLDRTLRGRLDDEAASSRLSGLDELGRRLFELRQVVFFGCGSSLHGAEVGRDLIEHHARLPSRAEQSAELLARNPLVRPDTLYVAVSQSGETGDTLRTLREINARGGLTAGVTNVVGSSVSRETTCGVHLHAGPEFSVCSTKTFTAQIAAMTLLALRLGRIHHLSASQGRAWLRSLRDLPEQVRGVLALEPQIRALAQTHCAAPLVFFIGRGRSVPVAREGALKLKEVAYIPAEGLSAASMRHGALTLVAEGTPVWALVPPDETRERLLEDLRTLKACGASLMVVAAAHDEEVAALADALIPLPEHHPVAAPVLSVVPLQLFAYHAARLLGRAIDRPRNLNRAVASL